MRESEFGGPMKIKIAQRLRIETTMNYQWLFVAGLVTFAVATFSQVSTIPPSHGSGGPIDVEPKVRLSHNTAEQISRELLDTNTVGVICNSLKLTEEERQSFLVAPGFGNVGVWIYLAENGRADVFKRFAEQLEAYVSCRSAGHTRECLIAGLTSQTPKNLIEDEDLRILLEKQPLLPASWFKRTGSGYSTNKTEGSPKELVIDSTGHWRLTNSRPVSVTNEVIRWVEFTIVDRELAWRYKLTFTPEDRLSHIFEGKIDAIELDPKFRKTENLRGDTS
jgi:hypothetical protein